MTRSSLGFAVACCIVFASTPAQAAGGLDTVWSARYDNGGIDSGSAITVDALHNVYVTGSSESASQAPDYLTIKYSPTGRRLWTARYDGAGRFDVPAAIAVDGAHNVYVTGASEDASGVDDYATVKYSADGQQLWARRFDAGTGTHDQASDLAVDGEGNVDVTGWSYKSGTGTDYLTISYDPSGTVRWTARTSGTGSNNDYAYAVRADALGNVFVTGEVIINFSKRYRDYGTVKYDPNGKKLWLATYTSPITPGSQDSPHAMSLDQEGNVYVTGESWGAGPGCCPIDWATIKYDTNGDRLWVKRLDGPSSGQDIANDLAVDAAGNVVVTGQITTDSHDMGTVQYGSDGTVLWQDIHDDMSLDESNSAVAVDRRGRVFTTGSRLNGGNDFDWVTLAYSPKGKLIGRAQFGGTANFIDSPSDIAVVPGGAVVTGDAYNSTLDYMTIRYRQT
jgi:hypothetical protein